MKKSGLGLLVLFFTCLIYWFWSGQEPELPSSQEIRSVQLSKRDATGRLVPVSNIQNKSAINHLQEKVRDSRKTHHSSVQDQPLIAVYYRLDWQTENGKTQTAYLYEEGAATYLELPYEGIYRLQNTLKDILDGL